MIIRPVSEVEEKVITSLESEGKKIDVGNVKIKWLTHKNLGGYDHTFAVRHLTIGPGSMIPEHDHEYVEAVFVLKGKLEVSSGGETRTLEPNTLFYVPSFEPHSAKNLGDEPASVICCINCVGDGENCIPK
jgi:quercetin dioxygenase-like cupin family protein